MKRYSLAYVGALLLASCTSVAPPAGPPDPATLAKIIQLCTFSGLFKAAYGTGLSFVPGGPIAASLISAGVDQVCMNPSVYAADVTTVEWLITQLNAAKMLPVAGVPAL
jgi:hypothetical protein